MCFVVKETLKLHKFRPGSLHAIYINNFRIETAFCIFIYMNPTYPMARIANEFYLTLLLFYKTNTKNSMRLN